MLDSRVLGPIALNGGSGGGAMDSVVTFEGAEIPVRLEIDHPDDLTQALIDDVDLLLDHLERADGIARDVIQSRLGRAGTAPASLREAWMRARGGQSIDDDEFLGALRPTRYIITPDGGRTNLDRLVAKYELSDSTVTGQITVRYPSAPTGPEVDPAPRNGY